MNAIVHNVSTKSLPPILSNVVITHGETAPCPDCGGSGFHMLRFEHLLFSSNYTNYRLCDSCYGSGYEVTNCPIRGFPATIADEALLWQE